MESEGNWEEYKLMIETMHYVSSQLKEDKEKRWLAKGIKREELNGKRNQIILYSFFTLFYDNENHEYNLCKCHISFNDSLL